jgi:hypothetical protein
VGIHFYGVGANPPSQGNTIGGTSPGAGNIISANGRAGIFFQDSNNNTVQGNFIGTDARGLVDDGNDYFGIYIYGNNNAIGGTLPGEANIIAFTLYDAGVWVGTGTGNSIRGNSIHDNGEPNGGAGGIHLESDDSANNNQAAPILTSTTVSGGGTAFSGTLQSVPNTCFALDFYASTGADAAGFLEGQTYLGATTVTTDCNGDATFTATVAAPPAGQLTFSATATNLATGDTSEFFTQAPTVTTVTSSANPSILGQSVTFTATAQATPPGSGTPTGRVDFVDTSTNTDLGTVPLSGGVASVSTAALALGTHLIQASYSGDSSFMPSAATVTQMVTQAIYVLDPTANGALSIAGNGSIHIPGSIFVDSSSATALTATGNAQVSAAGIQVVGHVQQAGNASLTPAPVTGAAVVANPLGSLTGPSTTGLTNYGSASIGGNALQTLNPGIYSRISIAGSARVTLNPGLYLIERGGFTVSGNATVSGQGVTLYNTLSNYPQTTGTHGGITFSGTGAITLTAPTSGPYAGVLVFQPSANTRALSLSGNASGLAGTVYAPSAQVVLSGNAQLNAALVVDRLSISGNGVSTEVADGSAGSALDTASSGTLLAGDVSVYVSDPAGYFNANELNRIQDAINTWDTLLAPYNVTISEVSDPTQANIVLDNGTTSAAGTAADGVLGSYSCAGEITLLQGWNWYAGADPTQIGSTQYDFQTVVTHELGHALGLGGSADPGSPMYEILAAGVIRRTPTVADLNIPEPPEGADAERTALALVDGVAPARFLSVVAKTLAVANGAGTTGGGGFAPMGHTILAAATQGNTVPQILSVTKTEVTPSGSIPTAAIPTSSSPATADTPASIQMIVPALPGSSGGGQDSVGLGDPLRIGVQESQLEEAVPPDITPALNNRIPTEWGSSEGMAPWGRETIPPAAAEAVFGADDADDGIPPPQFVPSSRRTAGSSEDAVEGCAAWIGLLATLGGGPGMHRRTERRCRATTTD